MHSLDILNGSERSCCSQDGVVVNVAVVRQILLEKLGNSNDLDNGEDSKFIDYPLLAFVNQNETQQKNMFIILTALHHILVNK